MRLKFKPCRFTSAASTSMAAVVAVIACFSFAAPSRAEYFVMRSGTRLHVSGYQLLDGKYRLQIEGGFVQGLGWPVLTIPGVGAKIDLGPR